MPEAGRSLSCTVKSNYPQNIRMHIMQITNGSQTTVMSHNLFLKTQWPLWDMEIIEQKTQTHKK